MEYHAHAAVPAAAARAIRTIVPRAFFKLASTFLYPPGVAGTSILHCGPSFIERRRASENQISYVSPEHAPRGLVARGQPIFLAIPEPWRPYRLDVFWRGFCRVLLFQIFLKDYGSGDGVD